MISIKNVSYAYRGKEKVLNDVNLQLDMGKVYGLLGKNGIGKSTLLGLLSGLLFPGSGEILVGGNEPRKRQLSFFREIYYLPDNPDAPSISAKNYAKSFGKFYPDFNPDFFDECLAKFEVSPGQKLSNLSHGQLKKAMLAFALSTNVPYIFLDEPTNGLDITSRKNFNKLLAGMVQPFQCIVISSHQMLELNNLVDHIIILQDDKVLVNSSIEEIGHKLYFNIVKQLEGNDHLVYSENILLGYAIIQENRHHLSSPVNLEMLFNAAMEQPDYFASLFSGHKNIVHAV
ncbi:ABC transporter ATP-binding protein [Chitinophaga caeni]|uniref:ABC transporter ATP-binding protein n=1 Tax=Chitinophaga caeni TaxID=2029983 RepID=A0A291QQ10_9BACT|nr:ABC transporter ATP-binding protein [Chitinophaga caeni]ATL46005.1 ABC transporter ATP-binding protein [Chitinophaga caeni]